MIFLFAGVKDPGYNGRVGGAAHKHLTRLRRVWIRDPVYFLTTCTLQRRRVLANSTAHDICIEVWEKARSFYGWHVGRYVIMPDHVHFFCVPELDAKPLENFVGKWKEWTAKYLGHRAGIDMPLWQAEFFDRLLRSSDSHSRKWEYVRQNPVRAGLVAHHEDWQYQGCLTDLRIDEVETQ